MAGEVSKVYVSVIPQFSGGARSIADQLNGPMGRAGEDGGQRYAQGMASGRSQQGFASSARKMAGVVTGVFAAIGVAEIGQQVFQFFNDSVQAAGNMAETQSKLNEIFAESTAIINEYASDSSRNILLTRQAALDGAATFGLFAKGAGLAGDEAANFSIEMVALATDMSSFNNTSPEQAIQAIGAALRGESEPIRQFGVLLDDATLKARAMTLGIYDGTGALSQQQRVMAAHAEILAQTTVQQGDAARTADSFANRQRQVEKAIEDTKVEIGEALLPVMNDLLGVFMDEGIPALKDLAAWFMENKEEIRTLTIAAVDMGLGFVGATLTMMRIWAQFGDAFITIADNLVQFFFSFADSILSGAEQAFGWIPGVGERLKSTRRAFDETRANAESNLGRMRRAADETTRGIRAGETAVGNLRTAVQKLDGMTSTVRVRLDLPQYNAADIPGSPAWLAARGIPGRAHGGPVVAGRPYVVGERGPELIVPKTSGTVIPNHELGGGGGFPSKVTLVDSNDSIIGHMNVRISEDNRAERLGRRR